MENTKGKFFVIEGVDGVGKTSSIELMKSMYSNNLDIVFLRDQYIENHICADIKKILRENGDSMSKTSQSLLSLAAREILNKEIRRNLDLGKTVICDRYIPSTLVYNCNTEHERTNVLISSKIMFPDTYIEFDKCVVLLYDDITDAKIQSDKLEQMYSVYEQQDRYIDLHRWFDHGIIEYVNVDHKNSSEVCTVKKICEVLSKVDEHFADWEERLKRFK